MRRVLQAAMAVMLPLAAGPLPSAKPEEVGLSSERLQRIRESVMRRIEAKELAGAVTLVARKGKVVHFETHGVMDLETKRPMAKDTLFRLASTTKPVTAAAILIAMEEGRLHLTDPVSKYIPEFKGSRVVGEGADAATVAAAREIAILDLLTHTSGLASGGPTAPAYAALVKERKPADTLADFIPRLGALPLDFQPGTRWRYSAGAGFDTLGRIVEIASGMTFDQFLRVKLFEPLGMNDTYFNVPEKEQGRLATVYRRSEKGLATPATPLRIGSAAYFSGAGGLTSTAADYFQFAQMLCSGGKWNGKQILSPLTVDLMLSNNVGDLFLGQIGRPPRGVGFGLGGEVILNAAEARLRKPNGSYGWDGAFGTYWWVNRAEQMVAILFVQTPGRTPHHDFDNAVSQAVVEILSR